MQQLEVEFIEGLRDKKQAVQPLMPTELYPKFSSSSTMWTSTYVPLVLLWSHEFRSVPLEGRSTPAMRGIREELSISKTAWSLACSSYASPSPFYAASSPTSILSSQIILGRSLIYSKLSATIITNESVLRGGCELVHTFTLSIFLPSRSLASTIDFP